MSKPRIRVGWDYCPPSTHDRDSKSAVDEIVASGASIHIERMSNTHIWARIELPTGQAYEICFWTKKANLHFGAEEDNIPLPPASASRST